MPLVTDEATPSAWKPDLSHIENTGEIPPSALESCIRYDTPVDPSSGLGDVTSQIEQREAIQFSKTLSWEETQKYLYDNIFAPFLDNELAHLVKEGKVAVCQACINEYFDLFDIPGREFGCVVGILYEAEVRGPPISQHPYPLTPE